jgi:hypothetical protein
MPGSLEDEIRSLEDETRKVHEQAKYYGEIGAYS